MDVVNPEQERLRVVIWETVAYQWDVGTRLTPPPRPRPATGLNWCSPKDQRCVMIAS